METCERCLKPIEDPETHGQYKCPYEPRRVGFEVLGDSFPGGYWVRHGLCNPDGTPRRYDSMTELKREANKRGLTIGGDTPKPYKVKWDGKRKES